MRMPAACFRINTSWESSITFISRKEKRSKIINPRSMSQIATLDSISRKSFYDDFVNAGRPLLIRKMTKEWAALRIWNASYFKTIEGGLKLAAKTGDVSAGNRKAMYLSDYVELLEEHEQRLKNGENPPRPPYLHDVPLFYLLPRLARDIEPFPLELF